MLFFFVIGKIKHMEMNHMLFGMPTLIENHTIADCAALCRELRLDFIELSMSLPQYTLDEIDIPYFKEISAGYGIFYTIHLDENVNVADFNTGIADACCRYISETIRLAGRLGTPVMNMHLPLGEHFTLPDGKVFLFDVYRDRYLRSMVKFRDLCEAAAGDSGIKICVENCSGFPAFQREALDLLLKSPVFGLTLDVGHNHGTGGLDEPYIMENRNRLHHMHLHDALGRKNHLALGTGDIALERYLTLAEEQNCRVVLETKTTAGLRQSAEWLKQRRLV